MTARHIVHIIHRLGVGGLENGLVNLINRLPEDKYRHSIVCLTEADEFRKRLRRDDVGVYEMHKRPGQDFGLYWRLYRLLRTLKPDIVHTRNLATLECQLPAWLARVPYRVHGEHGWDVFDPDGTNRKYQLLRRAFRPLIHAYVPLSCQLEDYLRLRVGVPGNKIRRICNGVDTDKFHPPPENVRSAIPGCPFQNPEAVLIGTVGRMHGVKDQVTLVKAFIRLITRHPRYREAVRLVCVGEGPLRPECESILERAGLRDLAWLPGARDDIDVVLRGLDVFVLPSTAEGISNTILEAMATGLPVVATGVGGNPELVDDGVTGTLVTPSDEAAMADALHRYTGDPRLRREHGMEGRRRVGEEFSLAVMMRRYDDLYGHCLETLPLCVE